MARQVLNSGLSLTEGSFDKGNLIDVMSVVNKSDANFEEVYADIAELEAGVPTLIRKRYVIRDGIDGIVKDTVDDAQAAVNLAAMQAIVDEADANGGIIEMEQETIEISGGPLIVRSSANGLIWDSPTFARLTQRTDNVAILQLGDTAAVGQNLRFSGINLHYLNDQSGNTSANACVIYNQWKSSIGNIQVANTLTTARPYRGIYIPQNQTLFSCNFSNLYVFQPHFSCLHIANFGTGNAFTNVYLSGTGPAGTAQAVTNPFLWEMSGGSQMHDSVFNQLNVEWCITNKCLRFNNVRGAVVNSLHVEQCILAGAGPTIISNSISNILINSGAILDVIVTATDVTDAFPSVVRTLNNGRTQWNTMTWVNNSTAYITMPYYIHYQADNEGVITLPGKLVCVNRQFIDGAGTALRDNCIVDRTLGGTDMHGGAWGNLYLTGESYLTSGCGMTRCVEAEHRVDVTKTIYGQDYEDGTLTIPGNLTGGNITITLSNRMGPASSRWANVPVRSGSTLSVVRGGTTTNTVAFNNHDATEITTIGNGVATSRINFYFNGTDWVSA